MDKIFIGIDISKNSFDVCFLNENDGTEFSKYQYTELQMNKFVKKIKSLKNDHEVFVTMENTGIYHLKLAMMLFENNIFVAVENALKIKRFAQMKMYRTKTDRADAKIIAFYGKEQPLVPYQPKEQNLAKIKQIMGCIDDFIIQKGQVGNRIQSRRNMPVSLQVKICEKAYKQEIKHLDKMIEMLERELEDLIDQHYRDEVKRLKSIIGVGNRLSSVILSYFGKFEKFENAKQVISYSGLEPTIKQSGTSIAKQGRISKKGNRYLRKILYMAAMNAYRYNPGCKDLFTRLKERGKPFKVAIIAVANKLLRQIFAIMKNETFFDPNYKKT